MANEKVLIDSGATANFLDRRVAKRLGFKPKKLECPVPVKNVDGTPNKDGQLTHCVHLWVQLGEKKELMLFYLTNLGEDCTILGSPSSPLSTPKSIGLKEQWRISPFTSP
jgi:arylamine N-acetyltransferase